MALLCSGFLAWDTCSECCPQGAPINLIHRTAKNSLLSISGLGQGHCAFPFHSLLQKLQTVVNWYSFISVPPYMPKTALEKAGPHQSPAMDRAERGSAQVKIPDHLWGAPQGWVPQARSVFCDSRQVTEHKWLSQDWVHSTQCPKLRLGRFRWQDCLKPMIFMQIYKIAVVYPLLFLSLSLKADTNRM